MLKHVPDLKKDLREKGWWERETPEVSQTSFLRSENSDAELGFKFEWRLTWKLSLILIYNCNCFYQPEVRTPVKSEFQVIDFTILFSIRKFGLGCGSESLHPDQVSEPSCLYRTGIIRYFRKNKSFFLTGFRTLWCDLSHFCHNCEGFRIWKRQI